MNLEQLHTDLTHINSEYQTLANLLHENRSYPQEIANLNKHVEYLRYITLEKYSQLVPRRARRGLIDPLGSLIKIVTGNLDHDDALKYDKLTSQLGKNQIVVSNKVTLISKMVESLINNTDLMNSNIIKLGERVQTVEVMFRELATQKNWVFATYLLGLFNLFISNYRTVFIKLSEIETALALSRLSVLHPCIVNSTDLLSHLKSISNYGNLLYPPIETNLVRIEETITVKSYFKKNQITFIMEIPLSDNITYNYYKIYSLPIFREQVNLTFTIFPTYPFLMAKGMKYQPIAKPCRALPAGDEFLCTNYDRVLYAEPTCMEQLMRYNNATCCVQQPILIEAIKLQQVDDFNWIVYTRSKSTAIQKCNDEITRFPMFGTYMMTINEPCDVEVDGIQFRHHQAFIMNDDIEPMPIVNLPQLQNDVNTDPLSGAHALDMKNINLDELKYMSYVLKQSDLVYSVKSETDTYSSGWFIALTCVVVLSFLVFLLVVLRNKLMFILCLRNHRTKRRNDNSDNFALEEGEVMRRPHPSALD